MFKIFELMVTYLGELVTVKTNIPTYTGSERKESFSLHFVVSQG
jgi:hypothetical protein